MKKEDLKVGIIYNVRGEGIERAIIFKDETGRIQYGHPFLLNDFECLTDEFQERILRNITTKYKRV